MARSPARAATLSAMLLGSALLGCGAPGVEFTLQNVSATALDSVVVYTTGHTYLLGTVPPGTSRAIQVEAVGDSHIEVEHGTGTRSRLVVDTYFGKGYSGTVTAAVGPDSVVRVESHFR